MRDRSLRLVGKGHRLISLLVQVLLVVEEVEKIRIEIEMEGMIILIQEAILLAKVRARATLSRELWLLEILWDSKGVEVGIEREKEKETEIRTGMVEIGIGGEK